MRLKHPEQPMINNENTVRYTKKNSIFAACIETSNTSLRFFRLDQQRSA
jgi:hypothetical protein